MKRIMIDPGHAPGNANGGKNGYKEYAGMWKLSMFLKAALERCGCQVDLTRRENEDTPLSARGKSAAGYDLFISEHSNAANGTARGVEVYYSVKLPEDKRFAAAMSKVISILMGNPDRGAKIRESIPGEDYYSVISSAQGAGVSHVLLVESGFHDNAEDEAFLLNDKNLKDIAETQAKVICEFLECQHIPENEVPLPIESKETVKFDLIGYKEIETQGRNIDGSVYVLARNLLEELGFAAGWDDSKKTVILIRPDEYEILKRITEAEAGGEDYTGKLLVVNVIMNRVKSAGFPNNITDVVFAPMQFEPTRNGAYEKAVPSDSTRKAVLQALCGVDYSQGALFFRGLKGATPDCWHEKALTKLLDHGGHRFYK